MSTDLIEISDDELESDCEIEEDTLGEDSYKQASQPETSPISPPIPDTIINIVHQAPVNDSILRKFIDCCVEDELFDDSFYNCDNQFMELGTGVPDLFWEMADHRRSISRKGFLDFYSAIFGDRMDELEINYVFDSISTGKKPIRWTQFQEFFHRFIKTIIF